MLSNILKNQRWVTRLPTSFSYFDSVARFGFELIFFSLLLRGKKYYVNKQHYQIQKTKTANYVFEASLFIKRFTSNIINATIITIVMRKYNKIRDINAIGNQYI